MKENKLELVVLADTHLNKKNFEDNRIVFNEAADLVVSNCQYNIYHIGDVFDSREAQSLTELKYFDTILEDLNEKGVNLIVIPGNHDKMSYTSQESYLDIYRHHPNIIVIDTPTFVYQTLSEINIWMIPYFKENGLYQKYLEQIIPLAEKAKKQEEKNFLLTHCAIETVKNNDGSLVGKEGVGLSKFKVFDKVFVGHYHDEQELNSTISYIGSSLQHNFGENRGKGCSGIYTDGSVKTFKTKARGYIRKELIIGKDDPSVIAKSLSIFSNDYKKVRYIGKKSECDSFNKEFFTKLGIQTERKVLYNDKKDADKKVEFKVHTVGSIKSEFKSFYSEKGLKNKKIKQYIENL